MNFPVCRTISCCLYPSIASTDFVCIFQCDTNDRDGVMTYKTASACISPITFGILPVNLFPCKDLHKKRQINSHTCKRKKYLVEENQMTVNIYS